METQKPRNSIEERLSVMYYETRKAKDNLLHLTELDLYNEIFTDGERGSIKALIAASEMRLDIIRSLQIGL